MDLVVARSLSLPVSSFLQIMKIKKRNEQKNCTRVKNVNDMPSGVGKLNIAKVSRSHIIYKNRKTSTFDPIVCKTVRKSLWKRKVRFMRTQRVM